MRFGVVACVTIVLAGVGLAGCGDPKSQSADASDAAASPAPVDEDSIIRQNMAPDQARYVEMWADEHSAENAAPNDIAVNQVLDPVHERWCRITHHLVVFRQWSGRVDEIHDDGEIAINAQIFEIRTKIGPADPLFSVVSRLRSGDPVSVTGAFRSGAFDQDDCWPDPFVDNEVLHDIRKL